MTSQLIAIVLCTHGQRAVKQRPRIAAARGVSDTVSHWRTRTARNHMPAGPGCQRGLVFYGPIQGEKAMTTVIRGIVGGPYHPPLWRCHSTDWGYRRCDVVTAGVLTGQLIAIVLCTHGQRAVEQRPSIAAARGVSDTVSHWRTMTVRNHRPGCQRGLVFYMGQSKGKKL